MSDQNNLEVYVKEADRLVGLQMDVLDKIRKTEGLLEPRAEIEENRQSLDQESVPQYLSVLSGEKQKLETMDMVVAVVGTMKAGKSTTINAIVGSEVLPNRNAAMTAIPTLIRHTPGQKTPRLVLQNIKPVREVADKVVQALASSENQAVEREIRAEGQHLQKLLDSLKKGLEIKDYYARKEGVFEFLWLINDLLRVCTFLDVEFPFKEYDEVHELPLIEVEFAHLESNVKTRGRLTLLDTPGPNEAGQKYLQGMLDDQLQKASAIISVLNYTQLGTQADDALRQQLIDLGHVAQGRVFTLVNRFDEKGPRDPSSEEVKTLVSDNLLKGIAQKEKIFPVSALEAYLANTAAAVADRQVELPDPEVEPWVQQFGEIAMGRRWQRKIGDLEEVKDSADAVWEDSGFSEALEEIIVSANKNAPFYALDSAATKLSWIADRISNFVHGRGQALLEDSERLQDYVDSLKKDMERISKLRKEKEQQAQSMTEDLRSEVDDVFSRLEDDIAKEINQLFETGKRKERESIQKEQKALESATPEEKQNLQEKMLSDAKKEYGSLQSLLFGVGQKRHGEDSASEDKDSILDPDEKKLKYKKEEDAREFVEKVFNEISEPLEKARASVLKTMRVASDEFKDKVNKDLVKDAREILEEIAERFKNDGISLKFSLPNEPNLKIKNWNFSGIDEGIDESQETKTRLRQQSGGWGKFKRGLGSMLGKDWGYDEIEEDVTVYRINLDDLHSILKNKLAAEVLDWKNNIETQVETPINDRLKAFFDELDTVVGSVKSDLMQGITDHRKTKNQRDALYNALEAMNDGAAEISEDSDWLEEKSKTVVQSGENGK